MDENRDQALYRLFRQATDNFSNTGLTTGNFLCRDKINATKLNGQTHFFRHWLLMRETARSAGAIARAQGEPLRALVLFLYEFPWKRGGPVRLKGYDDAACTPPWRESPLVQNRVLRNHYGMWARL